MSLAARQFEFRARRIAWPVRWRDGLGLVAGATVIPHYDAFPEAMAAMLVLQSPRGMTTLGIDGETALVGRDRSWQVQGRGRVTVWTGRRRERFRRGEVLRFGQVVHREKEDAMAQATYSVTIRRPVDAVFAYVADGEKCPEWRPGVIDIKRASGDGVGTRYTQGVRGPMGRRIAADYEVTVYEPDRRLEFQTVTGPARPHGRYDFEAVDGGTRLTFSLDASLTGLRKLLMGSAVQKTMDSEVKTLDNLRQVLEA
jgi:uncharacterized protein YndB with AHSA1/START domain